MFDTDTALQEDHLHKTVQQIGPDSRANGFHLLNAKKSTCPTSCVR